MATILARIRKSLLLPTAILLVQPNYSTGLPKCNRLESGTLPRHFAIRFPNAVPLHVNLGIGSLVPPPTPRTMVFPGNVDPWKLPLPNRTFYTPHVLLKLFLEKLRSAMPVGTGGKSNRNLVLLDLGT